MTGTSARLATALVDRYRIERELGAGGMATVWLAHDLKHDRPVAIKVLHPHLAALVGAVRFLKEIRTTAHLQHPHILPLFDSGEADGLLFYVMPFVDGESLRSRIDREKQLPIADAVRIASDVASALDYAHRHGVIHRDVKPENILLHDGQTLVADFGIALAPGTNDTRLTETGISIGTPPYMSPEQALGERELDARSDIYAVGAVLYEMLTGSPPFTGPSVQAIVAKVITERPVPPSRVRKETPAHVEGAVLIALQKDPADRFPTASALQSALLGETAARRPRRSRRAMWVVGVAGLIAAGALAVRPWQRTPHVALRAAPDTAAKRLADAGAFWSKQRTFDGCEKSIKLYSQATNRDSTYAEAWGGLAKAEALCALFGAGDPDVRFATAKGPAETALRLDSGLSDAYTARGIVHLFHEQNFPAAEADFIRATTLDSARYEPWLFRSWAYVAADQLDSAEYSMRHAKALRPIGDLIVGVRLATVLRLRGKLSAAQSELDEVLQVDSNSRLARTELFELYIQHGGCARARPLLPWVAQDPTQYGKALGASYWAICGHAALAWRYADSLAAHEHGDEYIDRFALAMVYAALADSAKVYQALNEAVAQHDWALFFLHHHDSFRTLVDTPEFRQLMARAHVR